MAIYTPQNSIQVGNIYRTLQIFTRDISSAENDKQHHCIVTDKNKAEYSYPFSISYLIKTFPELPFLLIHKSRMVSCDFISKELNHKFDSELITMMGGKEMVVCRALKAMALEYALNNKTPQWADVLEMIKEISAFLPSVISITTIS